MGEGEGALDATGDVLGAVGIAGSSGGGRRVAGVDVVLGVAAGVNSALAGVGVVPFLHASAVHRMQKMEPTYVGHFIAVRLPQSRSDDE